MRIARIASRALYLALSLATLAAHAQGRPDPAALVASQRQAMNALSFMDGTWRGSAWSLLPSGEKHTLTQTERVGPFLDGTVKLVEGRGYEPDGKVGFNALGVISFNPATSAFSIRSYAMGYAGDFKLEPNETGFTWEIPAGPVKIRYTATIKDGTWHEVGDRLSEGAAPLRIFEMKLERIGDTDWPAGGAVPAK